MKKPIRLELNNSGSWKLLGIFDADDEVQTVAVMEAAEELVKSLHWGSKTRKCPTLRVMLDAPAGIGSALVRWDLENGWRDAVNGEPA